MNNSGLKKKEGRIEEMNARRSLTMKNQRTGGKLLNIPKIQLVPSQSSQSSGINPSASLNKIEYQGPLQNNQSKPRSPSVECKNYSFNTVAQNAASNILQNFVLERIKSNYYQEPDTFQHTNPTHLNKLTSISDLDRPYISSLSAHKRRYYIWYFKAYN